MYIYINDAQARRCCYCSRTFDRIVLEAQLEYIKAKIPIAKKLRLPAINNTQCSQLCFQM